MFESVSVDARRLLIVTGFIAAVSWGLIPVSIHLFAQGRYPLVALFCAVICIGPILLYRAGFAWLAFWGTFVLGALGLVCVLYLPAPDMPQNLFYVVLYILFGLPVIPFLIPWIRTGELPAPAHNTLSRTKQ